MCWRAIAEPCLTVRLPREIGSQISKTRVEAAMRQWVLLRATTPLCRHVWGRFWTGDPEFFTGDFFSCPTSESPGVGREDKRRVDPKMRQVLRAVAISPAQPRRTRRVPKRSPFLTSSRHSASTFCRILFPKYSAVKGGDE